MHATLYLISQHLERIKKKKKENLSDVDTSPIRLDQEWQCFYLEEAIVKSMPTI